MSGPASPWDAGPSHALARFTSSGAWITLSVKPIALTRTVRRSTVGGLEGDRREGGPLARCRPAIGRTRVPRPSWYLGRARAGCAVSVAVVSAAVVADVPSRRPAEPQTCWWTEQQDHPALPWPRTGHATGAQRHAGRALPLPGSAPDGSHGLRNWLPANLLSTIGACPGFGEILRQTKATVREMADEDRRHGSGGAWLRHRRTVTTDFVVARPKPPPQPRGAANSHVRLY